MQTNSNQTCFPIELAGQRGWLELTEADGNLTICRLSSSGKALRTTSPLLIEARNQVEQYIAGQLDQLDLPMAPSGTTFQKQVWDLTRSIPPGEVRSYGWLAENLGRPSAMRAVGQAMGANPILLFVPCHRVVRTGGALGGFGCGLHWKIALLDHEQAYSMARLAEV